MPISINAQMKHMPQVAFSEISYAVMREVFLIHKEMGCLFNEKVYQNALVARLPDSQKEVRINVDFRNFHKPYYMDIVVSNGAVFELKVVDTLNNSHRTQLLNYLFLSGLSHGKLINCGSERVEHEFINTNLTHAKRTSFAIDDTRWQPSAGFNKDKKTLLTEMVQDWGTGLVKSLYEEAFVHLSGGEANVYKEINVHLNHTTVAHQKVLSCNKGTAVKITAFTHNLTRRHTNLMKFLNCTDLDTIQWINIALNKLTFTTLK